MSGHCWVKKLAAYAGVALLMGWLAELGAPAARIQRLGRHTPGRSYVTAKWGVLGTIRIPEQTSARHIDASSETQTPTDLRSHLGTGAPARHAKSKMFPCNGLQSLIGSVTGSIDRDPPPQPPQLRSRDGHVGSWSVGAGKSANDTAKRNGPCS